MRAESRQSLRQQLREQRKALSSQELEQAAVGLAKQAEQYEPLWRAEHVLSYQAFSGEISPALVHAEFTQQQLWLPRITDFKQCQMAFYPAGQHTLERNRYGIDEPAAQLQTKQAQELDVVLMPLVGFDRAGNRLGMGAGFYDRALAGLNRSLPTPKLVGLAHYFQEIEALDAQDWDVPMDAIITDRELIQLQR